MVLVRLENAFMIPNDEVGYSASGDERTVILAQAASKAVEGLKDQVEALGVSPDLARSFEEGMRLGLLGDFDRAHHVMMKAGFNDVFVSEWLGEVKEKMASNA